MYYIAIDYKTKKQLCKPMDIDEIADRFKVNKNLILPNKSVNGIQFQKISLITKKTNEIEILVEKTITSAQKAIERKSELFKKCERCVWGKNCGDNKISCVMVGKCPTERGKNDK